MEFIWHLKEEVNIYWGLGSLGILFLCALLFYLVQKKRNKEVSVYLWYVFLTLFAIMNPISMYVIDLTGNMDVYERFFWLLFAPVLIAVCLSDISVSKKMLIPCIALVVLCGRIVFTDTEYKEATHAYKIDKQTIEVNDIIIRHFENLDESQQVIPNRTNYEGPSAMITDPLCESIRMYNANIKLLYVRKDFGSYNYKRYNKISQKLSLENEEINIRYFVNQMKKKKFDYLVIGDWQHFVGNIEKYPALKQIGATENYRVYFYDRNYVKKGQYRVTQYKDSEGYQQMCYTIEDSNGGLIVIDGGRAWQSQKLVDIIKEKGGRVDYWIITHPHDDHAGVLASILEAAWDKSEIEIGQILIGEMDEEAVMKQDIRTDAYQYLLRGLEARDNVTWLKAGDSLEVLGLKMDVLHTCNDTIVKHSDNILNDGSMVFKLSAKKHSFLFLGDIGDNSSDTVGIPEASKLIAQEMMAEYGELLPSTYVQMAHHGNSTLPDEFYEMIQPKKAFFDAPKWLMENKNKETGETSYYRNPHYKELMERLGAKVIAYRKNPVSVILR